MCPSLWALSTTESIRLGLFSCSFNGHLCFRLSVTVNKAHMNIILDISTVFLSKYLGVELLGCRLGIYLTLLEIV